MIVIFVIKTRFMQPYSHRIWFPLLVWGLAWAMSACNSEVQQSLTPTPTAYGKVNHVTIIADTSIWNGPVGDSIRFYYSSAYLILPQPEPIFDLDHVTPEELAMFPVKRELRTYMIVGDLSDPNSSTSQLIRDDLDAEQINASRQNPGYGTKAGRDKWATGQLLVYMYAFNEADLIKNLIASFPAVKQRINEADRPRLEATVYFNGEDQGLQEEARATMGVSMHIPKGYVKAINENNFMWMRLETTDLSSNIMLHKVPYKSPKQLSREGIKAIRDSLGRAYISSTLANTYMRINDWDLPLFVEQVTFNGDYAIEARGIWEIENDFMGGAFVCYLVYDPAHTDLLFIDGFVHAPGKDKRDYMQQLEHVLRSAKY